MSKAKGNNLSDGDVFSLVSVSSLIYTELVSKVAVFVTFV
jgi:hypothetical protein